MADGDGAGGAGGGQGEAGTVKVSEKDFKELKDLVKSQADSIKELRKENADRRVKAKTATSEKDGLVKTLLVALGHDDKDGKDTDLAKEVKGLKNQLGRFQLKDRFGVLAKKAGADPDLSFAMLQVEGAFDGEFEDEAISATLKEMVEANPKLKATRDPVKVGDTHGDGGDPGKGGGESKNMNAMIRAAAGRQQ